MLDKRNSLNITYSAVTPQSAIKAGYSVNYANKRAHELLGNVGVAEYISLIRKSK